MKRNYMLANSHIMLMCKRLRFAHLYESETISLVLACPTEDSSDSLDILPTQRPFFSLVFWIATGNNYSITYPVEHQQ